MDSLVIKHYTYAVLISLMEIKTKIWIKPETRSAK